MRGMFHREASHSSTKLVDGERGIVARMELLRGESLIWQGHPTWRASLSFHAKGFLLSLVPLVLVLLLGWAGVDLPVVWAVLLLVVGVALTVAASWVMRFFTQYTITTKRLQIRRGILSKTETSANVDRIQNITVFQSPLDRMLKVGAIDFDTASDDPSDRFGFAGVNEPQALRERIVRARDENQRTSPSNGQGGLA
jgi:uncharacterized membrane protein YdbT with pleckstrin-like domain